MLLCCRNMRYGEGQIHQHRACLGCLYSRDLVTLLLKDSFCKGVWDTQPGKLGVWALTSKLEKNWATESLGGSLILGIPNPTGRQVDKYREPEL